MVSNGTIFIQSLIQKSRNQHLIIKNKKRFSYSKPNDVHKARCTERLINGLLYDRNSPMLLVTLVVCTDKWKVFHIISTVNFETIICWT